MEEEYFCQNLQCVIVKNRNLSRSSLSSLSSLGIKTLLGKIPLVGPLLFYRF